MRLDASPSTRPTQKAAPKSNLPHRFVGLLALVIIVCTPLSTPVAQGLEISALVKAGVELDTNPERLNGIDIEAEVVERFFAELRLVSEQTSQSIDAVVRVGGKNFSTTTDENTIVVDMSGRYRRYFTPEFGGYIRLYGRHRAEVGHQRDYTRFGTNLGLFARFGRATLNLGPGLRTFLYRPNPDLSNTGIGVTTVLNWQPISLLQMGVNYSWSQRNYRQTIDRTENTDHREDNTHGVQGTIRLQSSFVATLELFWQRNLSNTEGKPFNRLGARISTTIPLFWEIFLTGQASVQRTLFDDPLLVDPTFTIEDDNRNTLVLAATRDIAEWLRFEIRYSLYLQEFGGDDEDYERMLIYGGLVGVVGD